MTEYRMPQDLLDRIINYLASRPYHEVAGGIEALKALQPLDPGPKAVE